MNIFLKVLLVISIYLSSVGPTLARDDSKELSADGLGRIRIGMSIDQVNRQLHVKIIPHSLETRAMPNCDYNTVSDMPGIAFLFIDDKLSRIDVEKSGWVYARKIAVGISKREFIRLVPDAKTENIDHVPEGISYVLDAKNSKNSISFQFETEHLTRMIVGNPNAIRYAEGCQ